MWIGRNCEQKKVNRFKCKPCQAQFDHVSGKHMLNGGLHFILLGNTLFTLLELEAESWLSLNPFP